MHPLSRSLAPLIVAAVVLVAPLALGPALGSAQDVDLAQAARDAAREAYGRGQSLYQAGEYVESEAAFMQAYAIIPNPVVLIGVAESRERRGDAAGAIAMFERYLSERADAPDADSIRTRIADLRTGPATLAITSTPPGAAIAVDGDDAEEVTPAELQVPAGDHTVALTLEGHEASEQTVTAVAGTRHEVAAELGATASDPAFGDGDPIDEPEVAVEEEAAAADDGPSTGVWVSAGIAAGSLVAGTVVGFLALSEEGDFDNTPTDAIADKGETYALVADVFFGLAAAAAITGLVLYLTGDEDEDSESARLDVAPLVGPNGGGLSARVQF